MSDVQRELTRDELLAQRNHYLAGCSCPLRAICVPHAWSGTNYKHHTICADHDHVERRSGIDRRSPKQRAYREDTYAAR